MKNFIILSVLLISTQVLASDPNKDVIYGEDNRKDVFESTDSVMVEAAKSTAGKIANEKLTSANGVTTIKGETLKARGICADERFASQITAPSCSGFLVSEDILVTAGHCIRSMEDCSTNKWVFDYKLDSAKQNKITVPTSNVYACTRIIEHAYDSKSGNDFAVVKLDRKVSDRRPLPFRRSGFFNSSRIALGEEVVVIGHPSGLPTKIADGATVRSLKPKFFVANLDTYGGNSGSAVFNQKTGEVEGILVRGADDYGYDSDRQCMASIKCPQGGCRGGDVTYITNIKSLKNL